jgi:hypothetical protein
LDSEEDEPPPRKTAREGVSPQIITSGTDFEWEGSSDSLVDNDSPPPEPYPPPTRPTTRARLVLSRPVAAPDGGPSLTVVDDDDLDPELDESLLTQVTLTPHQLLDGYLKSEENKRSVVIRNPSIGLIFPQSVALQRDKQALERFKLSASNLNSEPEYPSQGSNWCGGVSTSQNISAKAQIGALECVRARIPQF